MPLLKKPVGDLTLEDIRAYPVWRYLLEEEGVDGQDESWVTPEKNLSVSSLANHVVGTQVRLQNGETYWAILSEISLNSQRKTHVFIGIDIEHAGSWFTLMRLGEIGYDRYGPEQLAAFLGFPLAEIFPLSYDLSAIAIGDPDVIQGTIQAEPPEQLTLQERIALALEQDYQSTSLMEDSR